MRLATFVMGALVAASSPALAQQSAAIELWNQKKVAFGIFVPNEDPAPRASGAPAGERRPAVYTAAGAERLAANPAYDFLFLNMEGGFDAAGVKAVVQGLRSGKAAARKTLLVRIPPIARDGADAARARVKQSLELGADGVIVPHVTSVDEARQAIGFFREAGVNVWTPANPKGDRIALLLVEDPKAVAQAAEIAKLSGYSALACGIGSLTQALGGDREGAERGTQQVLAETKRARLVNMITTTPRDVEQRVAQGFLALIAQGQNADEAIAVGRKAAGR